jgi:cell division protease FtsH
MALGGRAAEEIVFGKISTGALSDLERITKMAYSMVSVYGMNEKIGNVSFYDSKDGGDYKFTKPYSEETARVIDEEVGKLIAKAYAATKKLLTEKRDKLEILAQQLLEKEIIFQSDLEKLIGKRPFEQQTTYEAYTNGKIQDQLAKDKKAKKEEEKAKSEKAGKDTKTEKENKEEAAESVADETKSSDKDEDKKED